MFHVCHACVKVETAVVQQDVHKFALHLALS